MKFFTREWQSAPYSDENTRVTIGLYWSYVDSIANRLTPEVLALAELDVHDGIFKNLDIDLFARTISFRLRIGWNEPGYSDALIQFADAAVVTPHPQEFIRYASDPKTELLYWEVDVTDTGCFVYRALLWPAGEIEIEFRTVTNSQTQVASRDAP